MKKLDELLCRVADEQDSLRAADPLPERIASRFRHFSPQPRRRAPVWAALAAAAAVLVLGAVGVGGFQWVRERPALSVSVGPSGGTPLVGAWLGAPDAGVLPLEFSDGSRFELAPRARARVVALDRANARVELASGSLDVHVVPGRGVGWRIDVGPFGVRITGTRFVVSYVPDDDAFELSVTEGQVELSGCMFGAGRKLAMGQRVRASCRKRTVDVSYDDVAVAVAGAEAPTPAASGEAAAEPQNQPLATAAAVSADAPRPGPAGSSAASAEGWLPLARAGKYDEAQALVEREGFEAVSLRAGPEALTLLAEVARHGRAARRAEHVLLTLRRRFAGSNDAALAAFTLGRLAFDEHHSYSSAAEWFRTYLRERPGGAMAREALGRLIEASHRAQDAANARALSERYLREYPTGPHAELASRLVASP